MIQEIEIFYQLNKNRAQSASSKTIDIVSSDIQRSVTNFHQSIPGYRITPLAKLTRLAKHLGISDLWVKNEGSRFDLKAFKVLGASYAIGKLWVKNEGSRFDLKAFKVLGASYAIGKLLAKKLQLDVNNFTFEQLVSHAQKFHDLIFVTATMVIPEELLRGQPTNWAVKP
jgi:diaminopropionate ammonia-lyase